VFETPDFEPQWQNVTGLILDVCSNDTFVWWVDDTGGVWRMNVDGSSKTKIIDISSFPSATDVVAIDVRGPKIYIGWDDASNCHIAQAALDGSALTTNLVDITGVAFAYVAAGVTGDDHLYWSTQDNNIGRSNLDGTSPNPSFIATGLLGSPDVLGIDTDSSWGYYANRANNSIGRFALDGSSFDNNFVTSIGGGVITGLQVSATNIFWTNAGSQIGRATLVGGGQNNAYLTGLQTNTLGLGITPLLLYFGSSTGFVGRAQYSAGGNEVLTYELTLGSTVATFDMTAGTSLFELTAVDLQVLTANNTRPATFSSRVKSTLGGTTTTASVAMVGVQN
jgi:hypothetical protein